MKVLTRSSPRRTYLCDRYTSVGAPSPRYGDALLVELIKYTILYIGYTT